MHTVLLRGWRLQVQRAWRWLGSLPPLAVLASLALTLNIAVGIWGLARVAERESAFEAATDQMFPSDAATGLRDLSHDLLRAAIAGSVSTDRSEATAQLVNTQKMAHEQLSDLRRLVHYSKVDMEQSNMRLAGLHQGLQRVVDSAHRVLRAPLDSRQLRQIELVALTAATSDLERSVEAWIVQKQHGERRLAAARFHRADVSNLWIVSLATSVLGLALMWVVQAPTPVAERDRPEPPIHGLDPAVTADVLQNSVLGIHVVDDLGRIVWNNEAEQKLLGYTAEEMTGRSISDFHVDGDALEEIFNRLLRGESLHAHPARMRAKDGSIKQVLVDSNACFVNGRLTHTRCFVRDVTGQVQIEEAYRASERRLRMLINNLPVGMFLTDSQGHCKFVNESWCQLTGMTAERAAETGWADALHPDDRDRVFSAWELFAKTATNGQRFELEYRFQRPEQSVVWVSCRAVGLRSPEGEIVEYLGTLTDVTLKRQAHDELVTFAADADVARQRIEQQAAVLSQQAESLIAAREVAEAASRSKGEFLANMSHEIRTPLNAILGMTDLVLDGVLIDEHRELLGTVHSSGEHLLSLINDVLDYSKIEAGKLTLDTTDFALGECVEQVLDLFAVPARQQHLTLEAKIAAELPPRLHGDVGRLRQILVNLVGNAIKFTKSGGVRVAIDAAEPLEQGLAVHLCVSDTGIGIPVDKLETIFRPFEQADGSTTRQFGGTGLGLSIVGRLVQMMNGRIWVESNVGKGSHFHVIVNLQASQDETPKTEPLTPVSSSRDLPPLRILLAEDNPVNQTLMIRLLEKQGHHVTAVADGLEAVEITECQPFHLVLMDMQMPRMSGLEATEAIRQREACDGWPRLPIVALTANTLVGDREACLAAGMDGYISKPVRREELAAELSRVWFSIHENRSTTIQTDELLARTSQSWELLRDLVETFADHAPGWQTELQAGAARGDIETVERQSHKLRGSASIFGKTPLVQTLEELETAARREPRHIAADPLARVERELQQLLDDLQRVLQSEPATAGTSA